MQKLLLIVGIAISISSCALFENKEKTAIEICQKAKISFESDNIFVSLFFTNYGLGRDATWLDFANAIAKKDVNKQYKWQADTTGTSDIYLVGFVDERNWGQHWEVNINTQIVREVNQNDYLSRKYGLSRFDANNEFKVENIQLNTLKIEHKANFFGSGQNTEIVYMIKADVVNNSNKTITTADIDGRLALIFKDKTVKESGNYDSGFETKINENSPWMPNTKKTFYIKTRGIERIYLQYVPEYVLFNVSLKAEDPVGYTFNKDIAEYDILQNWKTLKDLPDVVTSEKVAGAPVDSSIAVTDTASKNNYQNEIIGSNYEVTAGKAYFYSKPDSSWRRNAYLLQGEHFGAIKDSAGFVYCNFTNAAGKITKGWLNKDDLKSY